MEIRPSLDFRRPNKNKNTFSNLSNTTFAGWHLPTATFAVVYQVPVDTSPVGLLPVGLLPIATFAGRDICRSRHLPIATFADWNSAGRDFCRSRHLPSRHLPVATFAGRDICRSRHLPVATFAGRDICRSGLLITLIWSPWGVVIYDGAREG